MADVASSLKSWSTTASSNSPGGSTVVGTGMDDNIREIQAVIRAGLAHKGSDIVSATTTDLGAVAGLFHDITGANAISGFGTVSAGIWKVIKFEGALTLTHNATSLILPGGQNITTADGDVAIMVSEGSGNWRCVSYEQASGATVNAAPPGVIMDFAGSTAPSGWLECDGSAVSRTTYSRLFTAISTTWGVGDESTTFNLPDFRGKHRLSRGTGTSTESGEDADVDTTDDTLTVPTNTHKWVTGMAVVFNLTSGTITNLSDDTTYYVIRDSATTIKLASTLANAQNGTAIDFSAKSSPVWDITHTYTARTLGEYGGAESKAMSSTEQLSHTHVQNAHSHTQSVFDSSGGVTGGAAGSNGSSNANNTSVGATANQTPTNQSTGGNAAMAIMNPFGVVMTIIKT